eukprot:Hpha_TRINITY_DN27075_c0_g1::TRINITY_DN27075_c0_g1_i1::g.33291::m.33291
MWSPPVAPPAAAKAEGARGLLSGNAQYPGKIPAAYATAQAAYVKASGRLSPPPPPPMAQGTRAGPLSGGSGTQAVSVGPYGHPAALLSPATAAAHSPSGLRRRRVTQEQQPSYQGWSYSVNSPRRLPHAALLPAPRLSAHRPDLSPAPRQATLPLPNPSRPVSPPCGLLPAPPLLP